MAPVPVVVVVVVAAVDEGVFWRNEGWFAVMGRKLEAYHNWKDLERLPLEGRRILVMDLRLV